jgi:hypothetical protein
MTRFGGEEFQWLSSGCPVVERYDEGYDWRYVVRSAHGQNPGANLDRNRRGEVWRYRRT